MTRCACLVATENAKLLLVRVRDNQHWYLPGGKIEAGESAAAALARELAEELGISLSQDSINYLYTVIGPAYGIEGEVELVCYSAHWVNAIEPAGEISEVAWIDYSDDGKFAPAIKILVRDRLLQDKAGEGFSFLGIDHVQIAIPKDSEMAARAFYVDSLGMAEIPKPENLRKKGGLWLQVGRHQLHLSILHPFVAATKAHPAFAVGNLAGYRAFLERHRIVISDEDELPGAQRFYVHDPFGNRIEFLEWDRP